MMKKALITGSFDPVTLGHVDLVERACRLFDEVHFIAFVNPDKHYMFPTEKRVELMEKAVAHLPLVICGFDSGMVFEYVKRYNIDCIVKGARTGADFEYEAKMAEFNREKSGADTLILPANPSLVHCSSTEVRRLLLEGKDTSHLLPAAVIEAISGKSKF